MTIAVDRKTTEHARRPACSCQSIRVLAERDGLSARDSCAYLACIKLRVIVWGGLFELQDDTVFLTVVSKSDASERKRGIYWLA